MYGTESIDALAPPNAATVNQMASMRLYAMCLVANRNCKFAVSSNTFGLVCYCIAKACMCEYPNTESFSLHAKTTTFLFRICSI